MSATDMFSLYESNVRSYCHDFPTVFVEAKDHLLRDERGNEYLDFFMGAGALNYGHNPSKLKQKLLEYIESDGVTHSLDMHTGAKKRFIETFRRVVLAPRELDYKFQFTGPTGTNAVEAALKLARKITQRQNVVAFTDGFHGMTLGSLSVTADSGKRAGANLPLNNVVHLPFDGYLGHEFDSITYIEEMLNRPGSGIDKPAAFIVETVQGEGGINVASINWLQRLAALAKSVGSLLIIDDIQAGCGRTGNFFSFERAGIYPDIVCLSKSISGYGMPMGLVLIKPEYDIWSPGEHNGTFRGNNLAFVTAAAALDYWQDEVFLKNLQLASRQMELHLQKLTEKYVRTGIIARGLGMMYGVTWENAKYARLISKQAFEKGLIIETCGPCGGVVKLLPPLTVKKSVISEAFGYLDESIAAVFDARDSDGLRPEEDTSRIVA